ncbi:fimbrial protein, partial [Salmonella enterica subsp. enterica serovar Kentucky]|nr:fimbrial protein [Salmonella enterica subsp. enterica serovar Kentucky]
GRANITLQAYPVSTTGETPAEGAFTALASLRVDFD